MRVGDEQNRLDKGPPSQGTACPLPFLQRCLLGVLPRRLLLYRRDVTARDKPTRALLTIRSIRPHRHPNPNPNPNLTPLPTPNPSPQPQPLTLHHTPTRPQVHPPPPSAPRALFLRLPDCTVLTSATPSPPATFPALGARNPLNAAARPSIASVDPRCQYLWYVTAPTRLTAESICV